MRNLFSRSRLARELKQLAKENLAQGKDLSVMDDVVFKTMLSSDSDDSRKALRSLLSACTRREVSMVQVMNSELIPVHLEAKITRLDVHVTFNDGETADLEMQTSKTVDDLKKRAEYYTSVLVAGQLPKGRQYHSTKRVYQIFFLNFTLFPQSIKLPRRYFYQEEEEHDRLSELSEIVFYELPKLEKKLEEYLAGKAGTGTLTEEEKWCMYIKYRHEQCAGGFIKRICGEEEGIMSAERAVAKVSRDYIRYARKMAIIKNNIEREIAVQEGRVEGIEKGRAEGIEKGMAEGIEKGMAEGIEKGIEAKAIEIARKMKNAGRPIEEIVEYTGLSVSTIGRI